MFFTDFIRGRGAPAAALFFQSLRKAESQELTPAEKKEVMDDLREAFRELKLVKEGKLELSTWEDFKHELHR